MESIEVINIIDDLKIIYPVEHMQDRLNRWKRLVVESENDDEWNLKHFELELNAELAIIKSILYRIKK
jgi:hypothetical protein